jgi:hypothetical protein
MTAARILVSAAALALLAGAAAAEPLDRLFFTPERRAALERQRQLNIQETQTLEGAVMSLDGMVVRSGGKSTVWVNKRAQPERSAATGVSATVERNGKAVVTAGEETPAELRVGESINRATREKNDGLGGGVIVTKPAR